MTYQPLKSYASCTSRTSQPCSGPYRAGDTAGLKCHVFMPPTSKKLTGHICFGLCVCVRPFKNQHARVLKFHMWLPHGQIFDTRFFFFFVRVISFSEVIPLWKKSEWNLMHAISYKLCMLGFWNFKYEFLMEKYLTSILFLVRVISLSGVMPFEKISMESCPQDISKSI